MSCVEVLVNEYYSNGVDAIGDDIPLDTLEECMDRCNKLPNCMAWSYTLYEYKGKNRMCIAYSKKGVRTYDIDVFGGACDSTQRKTQNLYLSKHFNNERWTLFFLLLFRTIGNSWMLSRPV
jgi:hypothetical protein